MRIFGIDPGSERTGYGCIESGSHQHRLVICGTLSGNHVGPANTYIYKETLSILLKEDLGHQMDQTAGWFAIHEGKNRGKRFGLYV